MPAQRRSSRLNDGVNWRETANSSDLKRKATVGGVASEKKVKKEDDDDDIEQVVAAPPSSGQKPVKKESDVPHAATNAAQSSSRMTAASLAAKAAGKAGVRTHLVPMNKFPYDLPYKQLDLRAEPYLYRPARGEQGVLMVEPYKSELLPHWTFKQPSDATRSSTKLLDMFHEYLERGDFIGADMARKFIQMGFTRARRYANHKGGRKYVTPASQLEADDATPKSKRAQIPRLETEDPVKAESARIFMAVLEKVKADQRYKHLQKKFEAKYKDVAIPVFDKEDDSVASSAGRVNVKRDPG